MPNYAQTRIEDADGTVYEPGDEVPDKLEGLKELKAGGAVGSKPPEVHKEAGDSAESADGRG